MKQHRVCSTEQEHSFLKAQTLNTSNSPHARETFTCLALSSHLNTAHNLQVPWIRQCTTILHVYAQSKGDLCAWLSPRHLNCTHNLQVPWIRQCTMILHVYAQSKGDLCAWLSPRHLNCTHNLQVPWIRQCTTILHVYAQSKRWCTRVKDPAGHVRVQTHQKNPACTKSVSLQSEAGYYTEEQCKLTFHRSNHIQVLGQYAKA